MKIRLKSNYAFLIKLCVPFAVLTFLCIIMMSVIFAVDYENIADCLWILIFFVVLFAILIVLSLCLKFCRGVNYEFDEKKITVYEKDKLVETLDVNDIEYIRFYEFKFRYIITIMFGELPSGGCRSLHVKLKNGDVKILRFFAVKDVKMLRDKLYGELITIY